MSLNKFSPIVTLVALLACPATALAYIGPGMGAGAIAATIGMIGAFFLGLFAIVYYPIKRALRRSQVADVDLDVEQLEAGEPESAADGSR